MLNIENLKGNTFTFSGTTAEDMKILSEPRCPGLYFAGEYTITEHMNTAHGAYMSGIRAAEQVMSGYCIQQAEREKEVKRKKKEKKKKDKGKKEESEDEEEDTDSEEEEMKKPSKPKKSKERIILSEERRKKAQERDEL